MYTIFLTTYIQCTITTRSYPKTNGRIRTDLNLLNGSNSTRRWSNSRKLRMRLMLYINTYLKNNMSSIQTREELKHSIVEKILELPENFDDFYVNWDCYGYICWNSPYRVMYFLDNWILFSDMIWDVCTFFISYQTIESRTISIEETINNTFNFLNVN